MGDLILDYLTSADRMLKPGDEVTIRSFNSLVNEFGVDEWDLPLVPSSMAPDMEDFCGKTVTVKHVYGDYIRIFEDGAEFIWDFCTFVQT